MAKKRVNLYIHEKQYRRIKKELVEDYNYDNMSEAIRALLNITMDKGIKKLKGGASGVE